jgi:hypothetical protein
MRNSNIVISNILQLRTCHRAVSLVPKFFLMHLLGKATKNLLPSSIMNRSTAKTHHLNPMKKLITTALAGSLVIGQSIAAPFMAVGSSAEIFVTATAGIDFNDNVTLGNDYVAAGQSAPSNPILNETVFKFAPGLSYEFGKNALMSGRLAYVESFESYSDSSDLDSALSDVSFNAKHSDGGSTTTAKASFKQLNQNSVDLQSPILSRRDVVNFGGEHEMDLSAKSSLLFGFDYTDTDYNQTSFADRSVTEIPLRYFWDMNAKVDISLAVRYRETSSDFAGTGSNDLFYSIGARGDFTRKLSGFFRVGLTDRNLDVGSDRSSLGLNSDFTYRYSEKTQLTFGLSNDFGTSGVGDSQENFDVFVGFRANITPEFTLTSRISRREIDYFTRASDTFIQGSIGGEYTVNEYFQLLGRLNLQDNASGVVGGDFDNAVFSLSAKLRY